MQKGAPWRDNWLIFLEMSPKSDTFFGGVSGFWKPIRQFVVNATESKGRFI
jgi:hypothetical protein